MSNSKHSKKAEARQNSNMKLEFVVAVMMTNWPVDEVGREIFVFLHPNLTNIRIS